MNGDTIGNILWFLIFFAFILIYPRLMLSQLILRLEQSAQRLEALSAKARRMIVKKAGNRSKNIEKRVSLFQEFFAVSPSSLDPFGIVKKIDRITRMVEDKFRSFVNEIAPNKSEKEKQEINYGLRAALSVHTIAKIVRHYVEMVKKFRNLQIALLLQMQLPLIERVAKAEFNGTKAFLNGWPIGDSIGPLVAASLMEKSKPIAEGVVVGETKIYGRKVFVLKANGPGPELGRIDEAIEKILKKHKIAKVITIDAVSKLEGEKTGSVAFGVGFGMAPTAQREIIENILLPRGIPVEAIGIKIGFEEAILPMKKEIFDAVPTVIELIKKSIKETKKGSKILVIGVGNSSGIGNDQKSIENLKEVIKKTDKIAKEIQKAEEKKKTSFISTISNYLFRVKVK